MFLALRKGRNGNVSPWHDAGNLFLPGEKEQPQQSHRGKCHSGYLTHEARGRFAPSGYSSQRRCESDKERQEFQQHERCCGASSRPSFDPRIAGQ
jgi:hypothetical protein